MLTPDEKHVYEAITPEQRAQFCLDAAELMIDTGTHQRKYNPGSGPELPVPLRASVTLLAKGGQEIEVERDVAYLSGTIKNMLEGAEDEAVPLPNVGSGTLRMVLIYLQYHFEATKMFSSEPDRNNWDSDFTRHVDVRKTCSELIISFRSNSDLACRTSSCASSCLLPTSWMSNHFWTSSARSFLTVIFPTSFSRHHKRRAGMHPQPPHWRRQHCQTGAQAMTQVVITSTSDEPCRPAACKGGPGARTERRHARAIA